MKKRWISATLVLILLACAALVGCDNAKDDSSSAETTATTVATTATPTTATTAPDKTPDSPDKSVQISPPYNESDLSKIVMCDVVRGVSVDVSRNTKLTTLLSTVTYTDTKELRNESATAKYTLSLGEIVLTVYSDSSIGFEGVDIDADTRIVASDDAFDYLDGILVGEALGFERYTAEQSIEVYKPSGAKATPQDKADFIAKLNQIQYYQASDKSDYDTSNFLYKVIINGDDIRVYENFFTVGNNAYLITDGNFDFLKLLVYESSSGELPWL